MEKNVEKKIEKNKEMGKGKVIEENTSKSKTVKSTEKNAENNTEKNKKMENTSKSKTESSKEKNVEKSIEKNKGTESKDVSNEKVSESKIVIEEPPHSKIASKILILIAIIVVIVVGISLMKVRNESRLTITAKSSLEKIVKINKLSTIEYTYNSIVTKYKNNEVKDDNVEYYVKYEGKVTAGIDFNEIKIDVNYKDKKIYITLPEVEIHETNVDMGTLDYIFEKDIAEKDSISQEAYKLCKNDLRKKAINEKELLLNANENAKSAIEALIKPWIESVNKEFKIEFK